MLPIISHLKKKPLKKPLFKSIAADEISSIEFQGHMKEKAVRQTLDKLLTYSYKIIGLSLIIRDYVTDNFTLEKETIKKTII